MQVELPWHHAGHLKTGLKVRSAAVCTWLTYVPLSAIQEYAGMVPTPQLLRILAILETVSPPSQAEGSDPQ